MTLPSISIIISLLPWCGNPSNEVFGVSHSHILCEKTEGTYKFKGAEDHNGIQVAISICVMLPTSTPKRWMCRGVPESFMKLKGDWMSRNKSWLILTGSPRMSRHSGAILSSTTLATSITLHHEGEWFTKDWATHTLEDTKFKAQFKGTARIDSSGSMLPSCERTQQLQQEVCPFATKGVYRSFIFDGLGCMVGIHHSAQLKGFSPTSIITYATPAWCSLVTSWPSIHMMTSTAPHGQYWGNKMISMGESKTQIRHWDKDQWQMCQKEWFLGGAGIAVGDMLRVNMHSRVGEWISEARKVGRGRHVIDWKDIFGRDMDMADLRDEMAGDIGVWALTISSASSYFTVICEEIHSGISKVDLEFTMPKHGWYTQILVMSAQEVMGLECIGLRVKQPT
ncbi:hypothetical protein EDD15DRAFT_2198312 [Pisolithus albus]|nr:hypothetical protein EDD15DRAFT_2198312 [Pisolithus albus]